MGKNLKGFLAGVVLLVVFTGCIVYGLAHDFDYVVIWGLVAGGIVVAIDLALRRPGRGPNPRVMRAAQALGVLSFPAVALATHNNENFENKLMVFVASLCLVVVLELIIPMIATAKSQPGFWRK